MKIKHLLMVSLILAIFAIGAVSASEDIVSDDNLAVEDVAEDVIEESSDDDMISDGEEDPNVNIEINDYDTITYGTSSDVVTITNFNTKDISANLVVSTEDSVIYSKNIVMPVDQDFYLQASDLPDLPLGTYLLNVKFTSQGAEPITEIAEIEVDYDIVLYEEADGESYEIYDELYVYGDENGKIKVVLPKSIKDPVSYTFNDVTQNVAMNNGVGYITIQTSNLQMKPYTLVVQCGDKSKTVDVTLEPIVQYFQYVGVNQDSYVGFELPSIYSGTLSIYNYDPETDVTGSLVVQGQVVNGKASLSIPRLQKGEYSYMLKFTSSNYNYDEFFTIFVIENSANVKVSVPSEVTIGSPITVSGSAPQFGFDIYVDGIYRKYISIASFSEAISNLAVGQHRINVVHYPGGEGAADYSGLFYVTVKDKVVPAKKADTIKLTLKKVNVKKSAKKLVLQATLKINGKAVKGKVIKFKFNKKTLKAKTNKKGVAKVTVKKAVLKKLKKGKKITYTATYGKTTKKVTVKVKK